MTNNNNNIQIINKNIASIEKGIGSIRTKAFKTLAMVLDHGKTSGDYQKLPALFTALRGNASLLKDIMSASTGRVPYVVRFDKSSGRYHLHGKRDNALLLSQTQLERAREERVKEKALAVAKAKKTKAANTAAIASVPVLKHENKELKEKNLKLERELKDSGINDLQEQVNQLRKALACANAENERLKAALTAALSKVDRLESIDLSKTHEIGALKRTRSTNSKGGIILSA